MKLNKLHENKRFHLTLIHSLFYASPCVHYYVADGEICCRGQLSVTVSFTELNPTLHYNPSYQKEHRITRITLYRLEQH